MSTNEKGTLSRRNFLALGGTGVATMAMNSFHFPLNRAKRFHKSHKTWKFGVMADTQWRSGLNAGGQPGTCAVAVIQALNQQFIQHGVNLVIQVGDLVDKESTTIDGVTSRNLPIRAQAASVLYEKGIGFFPLRGNHEGSVIAAGEMPVLFPQMLGEGPHLHGARHFESPTQNLRGLSYAFDYKNVRFVLIDQFVRADGTNYDGTPSINNNVVDQVPWIDSVLNSRDSDDHAFVFAHKNLIGQNHKDSLFGASLESNPGPRDAFLASLTANDVRYYFSGHDHMHHRSLVKSTDGKSSVGQIICASNSYKFYIPRAGDDGRELPLQQELFTLGYYIVTVDGPRVYVDFYSSSHGNNYGDIDLVTPPGTFAFYLRESFGYSQNGKQFQVPSGASYTAIEDQHEGTQAKILGGVNGCAKTDYLTRPLTKTVNTGWSSERIRHDEPIDVLSLWGMAENLSFWDDPGRGLDLMGLLPDKDANKETDVYALSLTYGDRRDHGWHHGNHGLRLASKDPNGKWVNAVELNTGASQRRFIRGPYKPHYELGTFGIDTYRKMVWAVINYEGDFAVLKDLD